MDGDDTRGDSTELAGFFYAGQRKAFTPGEIASLAESLNWTPDEIAATHDRRKCRVPGAYRGYGARAGAGTGALRCRQGPHGEVGPPADPHRRDRGARRQAAADLSDEELAAEIIAQVEAEQAAAPGIDAAEAERLRKRLRSLTKQVNGVTLAKPAYDAITDDIRAIEAKLPAVDGLPDGYVLLKPKGATPITPLGSPSAGRVAASKPRSMGRANKSRTPVTKYVERNNPSGTPVTPQIPAPWSLHGKEDVRDKATRWEAVRRSYRCNG